jgi:hypothetical protein
VGKEEEDIGGNMYHLRYLLHNQFQHTPTDLET